MASVPTPPKSHFKQAVCLANWWLIRAENDFRGARLAVAGFTSRQKQAMRVFSSAPILKRYDAFTLETSDGICVMLKGFMNRANTLENGFPSDVCNHFVFGFPPFWKDYDEKFMSKESPSGNTSRINLLKKLSPQSQMENMKQYVDSHEKNLMSHDKMDAVGVQNSKITKSLVVPLPQTSDRFVSENNLNMSSTVCRAFEQESYSGSPTFVNQIGLNSPLASLKGTMKSLRDSNIGINNETSVVNDKDADDSRIHQRSRGKRAADAKLDLDKKKLKADFDRHIISSKEIVDQTKGRMRTRSVTCLEMKQKNNKIPARIFGIEKTRLNSVSSVRCKKKESVSADCEPAFRNSSNYEVSGLQRPTVQIKSIKSDACYVKDKFDKTSEIPSQYEDLKQIKTRGNEQKEKIKATRLLSAPAAIDKQKQKGIDDQNSLSENAEASKMKTRRKLAYETPDRKKKKVCSATTEVLGFSRSRSGRLLMPTLEFWRNQRAVYDVDRTITGIQEGIHPEQPRKGSGSIPGRKGRKL